MRILRENWRIIVPNLFTALASASALAAMYVAYVHQHRSFAVFLLFAGAMDMIDGPIARRLGGTSRFGNVYDSMSDFLAFGIAPAMSLLFLDLLYPAVALIYILAIQFRLTRYSAMPDGESKGRFFQGVSAPDCVYLGVFLGLLPHSNFNVGFLVMAGLAVYPGKLFPKDYRPLKLLVALCAMVLFMLYA